VCVLLENGKLWVWGRNNCHQIGESHKLEYDEPTLFKPKFNIERNPSFFKEYEAMQSEKRNERIEINRNYGGEGATLSNSVMEFSKNLSRADLAGKFGGNESKADISAINLDQKKTGEKSDGLFGFSPEKNIQYLNLAEDTSRSKSKIMFHADSNKTRKNSKPPTNRATPTFPEDKKIAHRPSFELKIQPIIEYPEKKELSVTTESIPRVPTITNL
jgi:hypothetical protein